MNITFIGMPSVGKSTIGKKIALELGYKFIDIDKIIENKEGINLQTILNKIGDSQFIKLEEQSVLGLSFVKNTIISPGGSIIYSDKALNYLKSISTIIYLEVSLKEIEKRLSSSKELRGIVGLKHKTLAKLYNERIILYKKYADIQIDVTGKNLDIIVQEIKKRTGI
jgi:shikimate kinase